MAKTTTKMTLPSSKVNIALAAGSVEPAMKAAEAKSTKLYRVPVSKIKVIPGFNVRVQSADYTAHRDMIANSIRANGFDSTKPLAGYVAKDGDANVIYVTDGHTRLDAVAVVNADAENKIDTLPVLVHPADKSLTDLTVALHTSNSGRPLSPFELGVVVKRLLRDEGADKKNIAERLAVTPRYLDDVLLLVNGPKEVRQAVLDGAVSSTLAIQELRKAGDKPELAVAKITSAVTASDGKKVTRKALGPKMQKIRSTVSVGEGTDMKEIVKAVAALVRKAIPASVDGDDEDAIKLATVSGTISLSIEVPAPEPAEKPVKAAKPKKAAKAKTEKPAKAKAEKAAKPAKAEKPAKKTKAAPAPTADDDENLSAEDDNDLGIVGAEEVTSAGQDDEPAPKPIAVKNGAGVTGDEDDVDI